MSPGRKEARGHIVDYGRIEVPSSDVGVEKGLHLALRQFKDMALWPHGTGGSEQLAPNQVWIDAGYMSPVVYSFCRETGSKRYQPVVGRGAAQQRHQWYHRPKSTGAVVKHIGDGYHFSYHRSERLKLGEIDADYWKTWVHTRLTTPIDSPGAMTLFQAAPKEHLSLAKHLTAERKTEEFIAGKGVVVKWEVVNRSNHWFDALYYACAAAHFCDVRLVPENRVVRQRLSLQQMAAEANRVR